VGLRIATLTDPEGNVIQIFQLTVTYYDKKRDTNEVSADG
jgi:hypothetical protein